MSERGRPRKEKTKDISPNLDFLKKLPKKEKPPKETEAQKHTRLTRQNEA